MKRNRFSEMIPPTPADFHGSVVDALNRMEAAERRKRASANTVRAVAAVAAMLVMVVGLVMMPKRPQRQDIVAAPNQTQMVVRPTEEPGQVSMEIGAWQVTDDGNVELEWLMTATDEETLVFCGRARPVFANGAQLDGFEGFMLMGSTDPDYMQIGRDMLGDGNGTMVQYTGRSSWYDKTPTALAIHFDVYRPTGELIDETALGTESFENAPVWWVYGNTSDGYRASAPIDWYDASREYKTYMGSKLVTDQLSDFFNARVGRKLITGEEALEFLKQEGALRTALLEGYDFAEHVKSFDFIVDLTARSGEGAENLNKDAPTALKQTAAAFELTVQNCGVQLLAAEDGNLGYGSDSDRVKVRRTVEENTTALRVEADEAAEMPLVQVYIPMEDFERYSFYSENAWIISAQPFAGPVNIESADSLVQLEMKGGVESVGVDAERSTVELSVTQAGTQSVQVALKNESELLLAVSERVEDFALNVSGAGEIKVDARYPSAEGEGYSYQRGTGRMAVGVSVDEGCTMQLSEIE